MFYVNVLGFYLQQPFIVMDIRYTLISNKCECHIPVQLQLARDDEFLAETLASSSGTGQVFDSGQSDTSTSDIDIFALLNHSPQ